MSLEAAVQIIPKVKNQEEPSPELVDQILMVGCRYTTKYHPFIDDIMKYVARFNEALLVLEVVTLTATEVDKIPGELKKWADKMKSVPAGIVIKGPETVLLTLGQGPDEMIVFDSHSTPEHNGAAILSFSKLDSTLVYLRSLFPVAALNAEEEGVAFQIDVLNTIEMTVYTSLSLSLSVINISCHIFL